LEANERLRLAKEAGELEREHLEANVIDLSNDSAAATRERQHIKTRTLTPAELREKVGAQWLELRNNRDRAKGKDKSQRPRCRGGGRSRARQRTKATRAMGRMMISECSLETRQRFVLA
jgi:hypothetical protein